MVLSDFVEPDYLEAALKTVHAAYLRYNRRQHRRQKHLINYYEESDADFESFRTKQESSR